MARHVIARLDPRSDNSYALWPFAPVGLIFSRDGQRVYLPTRDFLLRAWDAKSGKLLHVFKGHQDNIEIPTVSFDDKLLASGSDDNTLRLWDTQTGKLLAAVKNESQTFSPVFSPDNQQLAAVCMRALRVKVWEVQRLLAETQVTYALPAGNNKLFTPDGKAALTDGFRNEKLALRDVQTGRKTITYDIKYHGGSGFDERTTFSPDAGLFNTNKPPLPTAPSSIIEIRETASGKVRAKLTGHTGNILAVAFSPNGKTCASAAEDQIVKLWETATGRELASLSGHTDSISSVDFSPDSSKLATCGRDDMIKIWDVANGKELLTLHGHQTWITRVRFSPDSRMLASAGFDFTVKLWDAATCLELRTFKGHANSVNGVAFSPDGRRLASCGDDRTIRLWDVQTGTELTALYGHPDWVRQVFFTLDGKTLISASQTETRIWRAATEEEVKSRGRP